MPAKNKLSSRLKKVLLFSDIEKDLYLEDSPQYPAATVLAFDGCIPILPKTISEHGSGRILTTIDLHRLSEVLTKPQLIYVLHAHAIKPGSHRTVEMLREKLKVHECNQGCVSPITVFRPKNASVKPIRYVGHVEFPPKPLSKEDEYKILRDFIAESSPDAFTETGCTVCGQLTVMSDLRDWHPDAYNLKLLENLEATRAERFLPSDPIDSVPGPVIAPDCGHICTSCHTYLDKGVTPPLALCHGFWVGRIPDVLKDLTFAEQQLIAKVRHNICVMRVASGRGKLTANAVMFSNPTLKVYHALPPSKDEMSEVLAYIHLGSAQLTMDDYKRTPMLVRRENVRRALEWLRLNSSVYAELEISEENLHTYELEDVICDPEWRKVENEDDHVNPLTLSGLEGEGVEPGTESGPCSFRVHALTGVEFDGLSMAEIKMKALAHMNNGRMSLGIGHGGSPVSMYDKPEAYPSMFPWLFPFGKGGIGNHLVKKLRVGEDRQKRQLLLYYDKRFQMDLYFPLIAFNHAQLKGGSTGSYLATKRKDFTHMAKRLLSLNPKVPIQMAERMSKGEKVSPETDEEKECFKVLNNLDHVGGHVKGSLTSKKYMQNELWSLISHLGAPSWFITISPTDSKHPLSLYYADTNSQFSPELRGADERERLVAQNPVAAARFFHHLVTLFIKHVLGYGADHPGAFGETAAYYGTVEQQGRLTLHLHTLVWIKNCPSPQTIRDKMLGPGGEEFQRTMISYLESCHQGHLNTGSLEDIAVRFPRRQRGGRQGVQEAAEFDELSAASSNYRDPTQTMPEMPPPFCADPPHDNCDPCEAYTAWRQRFLSTIDDIISRSNVHTHYAAKEEKSTGSKTKKARNQRKGCLTKDGVCSKRFPKEIVSETKVDPETGSVTMKHLIEMINTVTMIIVYLIRSNTDTSSLLSGTAIKAVVSYVANYITKPMLKTYHVMNIMADVVSDKLVSLVKDNKLDRSENARTLMRQISNALTVKLEIGSPMASLYLLGNPDHYTSHTFCLLWWKSFVGSVLGDTEWVDDGMNHEADTCADVAPEKVVIGRDDDEVTSYSTVDDYTYRPEVFRDICVYDWVRFVEKKLHKTAHVPAGWYKFKPGHAEKQYIVKYTPDAGELVVANFVGGGLPRRDQGDREFYCCTMLTLFRPWVDGTDLKLAEETWDDAFSSWQFKPDHIAKMANFHVKYECRDEKDDYHKLMKDAKKRAKLERNTGDESDSSDEEEEVWVPKEDLNVLGPKSEKRLDEMNEMERIIRWANWMAPVKESKIGTVKAVKKKVPIPYQRSSSWKSVVEAAREVVLERRKSRVSTKDNDKKQQIYTIRPEDINRVEPVDTLKYLHPEFAKEKAKIVDLKDKIVKDEDLNEEQEQAFRIVADHATADEKDQLLMYLGGMGGTGKSTVLNALVRFFDDQNHSYRFLILAPTGTAAAAIGGSTYHWALGIRGVDEDGQEVATTNLRKVFDNLDGVEYVFIDEVSMVGCKELYRISAKIACTLNQPLKPFGGVNMIFAGDFAQLPPVSSTPLYSEVSPKIPSKPSPTEQEAQLGRGLWKQVTTVVILKKNMRQREDSDEDQAFRTMLGNLRYGGCTDEDIAFLRSRIVGNSPSRPQLSNPNFRKVPVIVTWNTQRDKLNQMGVERFARETNQTLHDFYSVDSKPSGVSDDHESSSKSIDQDTANILWNIAPGSSEHLAGRLRLCAGMPVLIRYNYATELGITKGQEALIHSWEDSPHPARWTKARVLDTLFVELVKPPKSVQLPGLPKNVVPLTRNSRRIKCMLPNDTKIRISRSQVEVLPLFAITDYGSQGKTRKWNVVELNRSRGIPSIYTALSRGTSALQTAIVQGFDTSSIKQGIKGYLRQEFRELELLNEISRMRYKGLLPKTVRGAYRNALLRSYQRYKGRNYDPVDLHPQLRWQSSDPPRMPVKEPEPRWVLLDKYKIQAPAKKQAPKRKANTIADFPKRRRVDELNVSRTNMSPPQKAAPRRLKWIEAGGNQQNHACQAILRKGVYGPIWDKEDHSCAYDSVLFILWNLWYTDPARWGGTMSESGSFMALCSNLFLDVTAERLDLNDVWNRIRNDMHNIDSARYPKGKNPAALDDVIEEWSPDRECVDIFKNTASPVA